MKKTLFVILFLSQLLTANIVSGAVYIDSMQIRYDNFLSETNLSQLLKVHSIKQIRNKYVIKLGFQSESKDSSLIAWDMLKKEIHEKYNFELEELLYFRWLKISKKQPTEIAVFIKDRYPRHKYLLVAVNYDKRNKKVKIRRKISRSRSIVSLNLKLKSTKLNKNSAILFKNEMQDREEVYKTITQWAKNRFDKLDAVFKIESTEDEEVLKFRVYSIKNEALSEDNSWLCYIINWMFENADCDFRPYEYHKYEIKYSQNTQQESSLQIKIDGRYAPSFGDHADWNKCTDMNLQFDEEFTSYSNTIKVDIASLF